MSQSGKGRGRGGSRQGIGGPRECICPKCGTKTTHIRGAPCLDTTCPNCGSKMLPSG